MISPADFVIMAIGKPWSSRATGPSAYDCWGLVVKSFEMIDGITLPTVAGYLENERDSVTGNRESRKDWWIDSDGRDGDVASYYSQSGSFRHVGRVINGGILHCSGLEGVGAVKWERKESVSSRFAKTEYKRYATN